MTDSVRLERPTVVSVGAYQIRVLDALPPSIEAERAAARASHHFAGEGSATGYLAVRQQGGTADELVVTQDLRPDPADEDACSVGVLLVPETDCLFLGSADRTLVFGRTGSTWQLLAQDDHAPGFRGWARHRDIVLQAGEDTLAAWSTRGDKLWSTQVRHPWAYRVSGETVRLEVDGAVSHFAMHYGP